MRYEDARSAIENVEARFAAKVRRANECEIWTASTRSGAGQFKLSVPVKAHRFNYEITFGPIPQGLGLRNTCGNRLCVRPDHWEVAPATVQERLEEKIERTPDGCWIWKGQLDRDGYGQLRADSRTRSAHRVAYELEHGPVPAGYHLHHACENPACVNPDHLEVMTPKGHKEAHRRLQKAAASAE